MKQILAYAILVGGVPNLIGLSAGALVGAPVAWICPHPIRIRIVPFLGVFSGLGSILSALVLFWLFGLRSGLSVPIISAAWVSFYYVSYHQSRSELLCYLAGIFAGWIMFKDFFHIA